MKPTMLKALAAACVSLLSLLSAGVGGAAAACPNAGAPGSGALPDCRAYELVSAVDKNGGDVIPDSEQFRVADDGSAATYASLTSFGDTEGGGIATQYMAVRTGAPLGQGWATHGIVPQQPAITFQGILQGFEPRYLGELSPDLSTGVLFAWRPVMTDPLVANVTNLYLRDDLRSPGKGSYELISACPACISPLGFDKLGSTPWSVRSTPDFGHVLFTSPLNLVAGVSGSGRKLYEWVRATNTLRLAGVLPNGAAAPDIPSGGAISDDGRRVFFTAGPPGGPTSVYMRLDGTTTVKLNASEATIPGTPQSANYASSSADGTRVFFTTKEQLTDDAQLTGGALYMYDAIKPDSSPDNLTFLNPDEEPGDPSANLASGIGTSADGRTVYFADTGQIVAGAPELEAATGVFVWHEGEVSFVSNLYSEDAAADKYVSAGGDLVFTSHEAVGPDGYDHGKCPSNTGACGQVYVYRIANQELMCASCFPVGEPGEASAELKQLFYVGGSAVVDHSGRHISDDGRRVFFTTTDDLVPEDTNGKRDAYIFDTTTSEVSLLSSGTSKYDSHFVTTTPSGDDAYFVTRERLVGWDIDEGNDLYDARVGGGFPEPVPVRAPCETLACRGPLAAAPPALAAASATLSGKGNRVEPRCGRKKGKARRKGKGVCAGKHQHKNRRAAR